MLLKHRSPGIDSRPSNPTKGLEHLSDEWVAVLRWLHANKVEHVLIGPAAEAIRGRTDASGPVAIVPAPYGRNYDRLARALVAEHARMRLDGERETAALKLTAEKLARGTRWTLRCGRHDIDVERTGARGANGTPRYQELLYESAGFEIEPGLSVEVASPEDIEHFAHLHRTGTAPEFRVTRAERTDPVREQAH
ncbi:MAG: hypothetical protein ACXVQR_02225 [Solirubrobacteraceae bacterium]